MVEKTSIMLSHAVFRQLMSSLVVQDPRNFIQASKIVNKVSKLRLKQNAHLGGFGLASWQQCQRLGKSLLLEQFFEEGCWPFCRVFGKYGDHWKASFLRLSHLWRSVTIPQCLLPGFLQLCQSLPFISFFKLLLWCWCLSWVQLRPIKVDIRFISILWMFLHFSSQK